MRVNRTRIGAGGGGGNSGEAHGGGKIAPTFTIDKGKVEVKLIGEGGSSMSPLISDLLGGAGGVFDQKTYRLAPPASGLTMMASLHPGISDLMYCIIVGSEKRLSTGMSKKPWI